MKRYDEVKEETDLRGICIFSYDKHDEEQNAIMQKLMDLSMSVSEDGRYHYGFFACYDDGKTGVCVLIKRTKNNINGVMKDLNK